MLLPAHSCPLFGAISPNSPIRGVLRASDFFNINKKNDMRKVRNNRSEFSDFSKFSCKFCMTNLTKLAKFCFQFCFQLVNFAMQFFAWRS